MWKGFSSFQSVKIHESSTSENKLRNDALLCLEFPLYCMVVQEYLKLLMLLRRKFIPRSKATTVNLFIKLQRIYIPLFNLILV